MLYSSDSSCFFDRVIMNWEFGQGMYLHTDLAIHSSAQKSEGLHDKSLDLTKVSKLLSVNFVSLSLCTSITTHRLHARRILSLFWGGRRKEGGSDDLQEEDLFHL